MERHVHEPVIAVVGCGRWGRNVVRDLVDLGCRVIAVDPSSQARADAVRSGAVEGRTALADGAVAGHVAGAVVAAPTSEHARLAREALDLGLAVFVEKPLTDDVDSARELVAVGGDRLFVMHKWHYHAGIDVLARLAADGSLGTVHGLTSERRGPANRSDDMDVLWLLGPHEVTIGERVHGRFPDSVEAVADVAAGTLRGVDVIARHPGDRWHRWSISTRAEPNRRRVIVHGSAGHAVLDGAEADHVAVHSSDRDGDGDPRWVPCAGEPPLRRELAAFRDHLLGGPPPPTGGPDGLAVVETLAAVRRAAGLPVRSVGRAGEPRGS